MNKPDLAKHVVDKMSHDELKEFAIEVLYDIYDHTHEIYLSDLESEGLTENG